MLGLDQRIERKNYYGKYINIKSNTESGKENGTEFPAGF